MKKLLKIVATILVVLLLGITALKSQTQAECSSDESILGTVLKPIVHSIIGNPMCAEFNSISTEVSANAGAPAANPLNENWLACTDDTECVAVYSGCCSYKAVNVKFKQQMEMKVADTDIRCSASCNPELSTKTPTCIERKCVIKKETVTK